MKYFVTVCESSLWLDRAVIRRAMKRALNARNSSRKTELDYGLGFFAGM